MFLLELNGEPVGSIESLAPLGPPGSQRLGHAYFCPECARIWATVRETGAITLPLVMPCETCPSPSQSFPPGSLWLSWDPEFNSKLPLSLLRREALLLLNLFEKS